MSTVLAWFFAGGPLMPVMLVLSLVLYALIAERLLALYGPRVRRGDHPLDDISTHDLHQRLSEPVDLTRGLLVIRALVVAMPLLGLLGTVMGIIDVFSTLLTGARELAPTRGMGQALITTEYGLAVAVPGLLADWLLHARVRRVAAWHQAASP